MGACWWPEAKPRHPAAGDAVSSEGGIAPGGTGGASATVGCVEIGAPVSGLTALAVAAGCAWALTFAAVFVLAFAGLAFAGLAFADFAFGRVFAAPVSAAVFVAVFAVLLAAAFVAVRAVFSTILFVAFPALLPATLIDVWPSACSSSVCLVLARSGRDRAARPPPSARRTSEWARAAATWWMATRKRSTNAVTRWATK